MAALIRARWAKPVVFLLCLLPLILTAYGALRGGLGANPIEYITHFTGDWTLRLLLITLAVSPLRKLAGLPDLIRFRRMLGLWAFFYGCLHLITWLWLDKFFDPAELWADLVKRRFITAGAISFALMLPLAVTSTTGWIRRLGRNWARLHRLIYFSAAAGVIHYFWLVKSDTRLPALYASILAVLLLLRVIAARRASRTAIHG